MRHQAQIKRPTSPSRGGVCGWVAVGIRELRHSLRNTFAWGLLAVCHGLLIFPLEIQSEPAPTAEHALKAAFLTKLPLFFQWSSEGLASTSIPIVIGVYGNSPIETSLREIAQRQKIQNRSLIIKRCATLAEATGCHILFIPKSSNPEMEIVRKLLAASQLVTVGESPDFVQSGGALNMLLVSKKVQLEICLDSIQQAGLRVDPQFLQLVKVVKATSSP